ncbi:MULTISPECIES: class I SAM-dependent methyltransferase [Pseudomonas]|uniref:class I SAM-dependent methyltransferase n=1 Tax=Pseudomonas mosselii TaxID=78327 RepID=UPI0014865984|nr:class I SAM-dependent methyltransferase [Pseudomonas mosselii]
MSQDIRLYGNSQVWDQPLQLGQRNLLRAILDFWPGSVATVLDVGCGDGKISGQLAAATGSVVVGLDSSEQALSRLPFRGVKGSAQCVPFADSAFDVVISTDALEHMPEPEETAAWGELFRVARKAVMVAVPFREELLDATAQCSSCGHHYHVNWHERSYDIEDLHRRAPKGWRVHCTVLSGEPWSAMLAPETQLRRRALGEWSGWEAALCPACGAPGNAAQQPEPLPSLIAEALAHLIYPALAERRYCRSHSEILVIYQREGTAQDLPGVPEARSYALPATCVDLRHQPLSDNLQPYCQAARHVVGSDGRLRLQFPLYEAQPQLFVERIAGSHGPLNLMLEDAEGCLFEGCVLAEGQARTSLDLPRAPVAGYYGILASLPATEPYASVRLGGGPDALWLTPPTGQDVGYLQLEDAQRAVFVQVADALWFDPSTLATRANPVRPSPADVLKAIQPRFERSLAHSTVYGPTVGAEINKMRVQLQNLTAERDAFQQESQKAQAVVVQLQNVTAERDALLLRAREADRLAVQVQNLDAEREALLSRVAQCDQQAVRVQNLEADRQDSLQRLAVLEQQAVQLQNLGAERDALLQRALEFDRQAVRLQNLEAERDALILRAVEADRSAVQLQNLAAERDALLARNADSDRSLVQLQNLNAEHLHIIEQAHGLAERYQAESHALRLSVSELQAQLGQSNDRALDAERINGQTTLQLASIETQRQQLKNALDDYQSRLDQLNQRIENRFGRTVRTILTNLAGKQ